MKYPVVKFSITNEMDIILAHKRASQICNLAGIGLSKSTSFVTAVSEICRNCIEHVGSGKIDFSIDPDSFRLNATVSDQGPGIGDLDNILSRNIAPGTKGCGLQYSRKLVEFFEIATSPSGTTVTLGVKMNSKANSLNKKIIKEWSEFFEREIPVSPYEEIKKQNLQLLDVTEQLRLKNLEAENLNIQLNKSNAELEDFAFTLSHDLKSPITNLKVLLHFIEEAENPVQKDEYIQELKKLIDRLNQMITGLIQIIDVKNNQSLLAKEIAFEDIVKLSLDEHKLKLSERQVSIEHDFSAAPTIVYYEVFLYSIITNLISNSIKYSHENTILHIFLSTFIESDYVVFKIQDNGMGMDVRAVGNNLFKPFKRFSDRKDGKGIGLHLVKSMVEKNGGKIEVESEPGKGTTFTVYLKSIVNGSEGDS